jgi:ATP-dependent protease ClpP protease subunit
MKDYTWLSDPEPEQPKKEPTTPTDVPVIFLSGDSGESSDGIEVAQNKIFFYSEVTRQDILKFNKNLDGLEKKILSYSIQLQSEPSNIYLHINSFGGSIFAGLAAVDYIKKCKVPVHTIIDGCAASAATLMSIVGTHRSMHRNSFMLIHQLSSMMWGKYDELQDDMKNNDLLMKTIKGLYEEHTKIPKRQLNKILKHDLWWDSETCLKYGLVDEIE